MIKSFHFCYLCSKRCRMRRPFVLLAVLFMIPFLLRAQGVNRDSSVFAPMLYIAYAYDWPGGDLKDRFGSNSNIGGGVQFKLKNNWIFGADFNYFFGNNMKDPDSLFKNIQTSDGYLINSNGEYAEVFLSERGFYTSLRFGKILPVLRANRNSGPLLMGSIGFMQHKIRIDNPGNLVPEISGDYVKGYDKLTNGIGISEFIGYMYMGKHRLISFFGGFECTQAFTESRRTYDFTLQAHDAKKRTDLLWGIKFGWIIPFYKKAPQGYYYN
jgi:hypothetical protein